MEVLVFYPTLWAQEGRAFVVYARNDAGQSISLLLETGGEDITLTPHLWYSLNSWIPMAPIGNTERGYRAHVANLRVTELDNNPDFRLLAWHRSSEDNVRAEIYSRTEQGKIQKLVYLFGSSNAGLKGYVKENYVKYIKSLASSLHVDAEFYDGAPITEAPRKFETRNCLTCRTSANNLYEYFIGVMEAENNSLVS